MLTGVHTDPNLRTTTNDPGGFEIQVGIFLGHLRIGIVERTFKQLIHKSLGVALAGSAVLFDLRTDGVDDVWFVLQSPGVLVAVVCQLRGLLDRWPRR